jgi:5-methylcytosine-specific restriction endonuclease McrBC regulatory subunit McrC
VSHIFTSIHSSHPSTSTLANNVDPVEQKTSSQIEEHRHLKEANNNLLRLSLEPMCSSLHNTQSKSSNDKSSSSNEKGQILTITYAGEESTFIWLGSIFISGRAKIELLHETESAPDVSQEH